MPQASTLGQVDKRGPIGVGKKTAMLHRRARLSGSPGKFSDFLQLRAGKTASHGKKSAMLCRRTRFAMQELGFLVKTGPFGCTGVRKLEKLATHTRLGNAAIQELGFLARRRAIGSEQKAGIKNEYRQVRYLT